MQPTIIVLLLMVILVCVVIMWKPKEESDDTGCEKLCNQHARCRVYDNPDSDKKRCVYT